MANVEVIRAAGAPRSLLERALCDIVATSLGRTAVHRDEDFLAHGDAGSAARVATHVAELLNSPSLTVADLFATRTVERLAGLLLSREAEPQRLERVAAVYREIAEMESADVISALGPAPATAPPPVFQPWIKTFTGSASGGSVVLFPHAGGAAAAYRALAKALCDNDLHAYVVQYPQRADRRAHPAPDSIEALARELFEAGDWAAAAPLSLFGHCMGAVVAFEFARVAETRGVPLRAVWVSSGQAPCTVAASGPLPTSGADVLADMVDLGGTDPVLLEDEEFAELLITAVQADYRALNLYSCPPGVRIRADIHAIGGNSDHRISPDMLNSWATHTSGRFTLSQFDGGHFYLNDHLDAVAQMVSAHVR
ncbi:thioesterase II family protein [Mycobacterium sp. ML4]